MIRCDDIRARIEARVPVLAGKLEGATKFADVVKRNALPQNTPAGFVILAGLLGGQSSAMSGMFIQNFAETISIVLVDRLAAGAADDTMPPLVRDVIEAVVGWGPDDAVGVFELRQAEPVGFDAGTVLFEINFALNDQMRIIP